MRIGEYVTGPPAFLPADPNAAVAARDVIDAITAQDDRLRVEHVGSSSVPGCGGKGYLDLLVVYPDGLLDVAKRALEAVGFQRQQGRDPFPEERPMRVANVEHAGRTYPIHAHVIAASSPEVDELRGFRARLRANPELQRAYEAEKRRVLAEGVLDGVDYAERKSGFVRRVLSGRYTCVGRFLRAPRATVYRALVDPTAIARWRVPDGMTARVHAFDARPAGAIRVSLTYASPAAAGKTTAHTDTYHGRFVQLVPDERVVEAVEFETDDPSMAGEMTTTITLADADGGTDLVAVHDALPPGVPLVDNETGWRMALANLAALVEDR